MPEFDLVVRNGLVVDGSGAPAYRGDVAVRGDTVVEIGVVSGRGAREIDAEGHVVAPGFVDGHTHLDAQMFWDPYATPASEHGVTSVVMGNCGFTLAPCAEADAELVFRSIERAEDMRHDTLVAGVPWQWESFPEYLEAIDRLPKGVNVGAYVGHCAVRSHVMGERAFLDEATDDDLAAMVRDVDAALAAGSMGLSSTRSRSHATPDGEPVASRIASWQELTVLGQEAARHGALVQLALDNDAPSYAQLREFRHAVDTSVGFTFGSPARDPDAWQAMLEVLDAAAAAGEPVTALVHCREFQSIVGFATTLPFDRLPTWSSVRSEPLAAQRRALTDPQTRAVLVAEALNGPYRDGLAAEIRAPDYEHMCLLDRPFEGRPVIADLARARGVTPIDVIIDAALDSNFAQLFAQPFANVGLRGVLEVMRHPNAVVAQSDTGAHLSQLIDASIPSYLLGYWVREQQAFTLEEGVRALTSVPARTWGLAGRGEVAVGSFADLVVFDPETIAPGMPSVAFDLPAGAPRMVQGATGITSIVCNGEVVRESGEITGALPGRTLRRTSLAAST